MLARKKKGINLVPENRKNRSSWGVFFDWLLNAGRYVIVATELIVISAFVFRFKLDRDLSQLYEEIEIKKEAISQKAEFEKEFRLVQERLLVVSGLSQKQTAVHPVLEEMALITPKTVSFQSFVFAKNNLAVVGVAYSNTALATLAYQLNKSPNFSRITIDEINQTSSLAINFGFNADWEGATNAQ
ncbi:PilN domain-containing protein [Patescibacteria group bacterium]|nr:PilN domain-containing protein [Patescibacteria group bacterium]